MVSKLTDVSLHFFFVVVRLGLPQSYFFFWLWRMCACDAAVWSQLSAGMMPSLSETADSSVEQDSEHFDVDI